MSSTERPADAVPPDTQAVLLLCGTFSRRGETEAKPLTPGEYNALASWLARQGKRPSSLLQPEEWPPADEPDLPPWERIRSLLGRRVQLALALEGWQRLGLWVIGRGEDCYPARLRRRLRAAAPPLLYGAGEVERLNRGGLAIVGSRDVEEEGLSFTRRVAERCADQGVQVISGGARGVDQAAVAAALGAGGGAVAVPADRLDRTTTSRDAREFLRDGRLTLVTPYEPEAPFSVGRAMGRNKCIYALADHALVVRFTAGEGGTWAGAVEQLRRKESGPAGAAVFVRITGNPTEACTELQRRGALPFPEEEFWQSRIAEVLDRTVPAPQAPPAAAEAPPATAEEDTCYRRCLPLLLAWFREEVSEKMIPALAEKLQLLPGQLKDWRDRAVAEGKITKKKNKKKQTVYQVASAGAEPGLFDRGDGAG